MSDNHYEPNETDDNEAPEWIKELRKQAKEAAELKKQLPNLQRENAILKAGVNTDHPLYEMFASSLASKGIEWTPENVKAEAEKLKDYGLIGTPQAQQEQGAEESPAQTDPDAQAAQRIDAAGQGGTSTPPNDNLKAQLAQAKNPQEFLAIYQQGGGQIHYGE